MRTAWLLYASSSQLTHRGIIMKLSYLVERRKMRIWLLSSALNRLIRRSLSRPDVLPSRPTHTEPLCRSQLVLNQCINGYYIRLLLQMAKCCSLTARYIQLATLCWVQSLTISDTAVCQVLCADTGGLWWWACTGLELPHWVSASRYVAAVTVHSRTCAFHWWSKQQRSVPASYNGNDVTSHFQPVTNAVTELQHS